MEAAKSGTTAPTSAAHLPVSAILALGAGSIAIGLTLAPTAGAALAALVAVGVLAVQAPPYAFVGALLLFGVEGTLPPGSTRIVAQTPPYDHCNFTVAPSAPADLVERFRSLLLEMSYDDPSVRPLLDLEGLKAWREGRTSGYAQLERAVEEVRFYDGAGNVTAEGYRP